MNLSTSPPPSIFSQFVNTAKASLQHIIHPDAEQQQQQPSSSENNDSSTASISPRLREQQRHLEELKQRQRNELLSQRDLTQAGYPAPESISISAPSSESTIPLKSVTIEHDNGVEKYQESVPVPGSEFEEGETKFHLEADPNQDEPELQLHPTFPNDPQAPAPGQFTPPQHRLSTSTSTTVSPSHSNWTASAPSSPQFSLYSSMANSVNATPATQSPRTRQGSLFFPSSAGSSSSASSQQPSQFQAGGMSAVSAAQRRRMSMGDVDTLQRKYQQHQLREQQKPFQQQQQQPLQPSQQQSASGSLRHATNKINQQLMALKEQEDSQSQSQQSPSVEINSASEIVPVFHHDEASSMEAVTNPTAAPHPYYTPQQSTRTRRLLDQAASSPASSSLDSSAALPSAVPPPHPSASIYRRNSMPADSAQHLASHSVKSSLLQSPPSSRQHLISNGSSPAATASQVTSPPRPDFLSAGDPREVSEQMLPADHPQAAKLNAWLAENRRRQQQAYEQDATEMRAMNSMKH